MKIVNKNINEIKPYENNPRFNDDSVEEVANSIKEFGFQQPIVIDNNGVIIAGHTRYKASLELGLKEVPCVIFEGTEEQARAYRLADNKVGEKSLWNYDFLQDELENIAELDMSFFGFTELNFDDEEEKERNISIKDDLKIIVDCNTEQEAEEYYNRITSIGIICRISTL